MRPTAPRTYVHRRSGDGRRPHGAPFSKGLVVIRKLVAPLAALAAAVALPLATAAADPPVAQLSGAIFTSDASGVPVNLNHYADKRDVYLNGGPGVNAPVDAAGLPAGIYTFQVTDPSGKTLLSTDDPACRQVTVGADGRFLD